MKYLVSPQDIAKILRELQRTSPTDSSALDAWDANAREFWNAVRIDLPYDVIRYLHDADIRIKDSEYRDAQNEMLSKIISDLERGIVPKSTGITISFHPRWLGLVALVLLTLVYLAVK